MDFDVVVVGGGPAGLATAIRLAQLARERDHALSICLIEKGSEIGAHIVSGAVFETRALDELFPDWRNMDAPVTTAVTSDTIHYLHSETGAIRVPHALIPKMLHNDGNYVISLGNLCRWLAQQAEALGIEILAGFSAASLQQDANGRITGVITGDQGIHKNGEPGPNYTPGYALNARYTVFAEGCRGHLGKELIKRFALDKDATPQHYAIGIKEIWEIPADKHQPGAVLHTLGWPLGHGRTSGGGFLYHMESQQVSVGLIVDLNYENPWLNPFEEFQRMKLHPVYANLLRGGKRISYGARAIAKGGLQSLPKLAFPGGVLVGDDAGFVNFVKIKGSHAALKSGMLAAEALIDALMRNDAPAVLDDYERRFAASWLHDELHQQRNCGPAVHKFGTFFGAAYTWIDQLLGGKLPFTMKDTTPDHATLKPAEKAPRIEYPKPDNVLTFDRLSSVFLSNTFHEEDQPAHLVLADPDTPVQFNLPQYDEPAQRYCPAGVYEIVREESGTRLQLNPQNCVHCKTCDIKDPTQNYRWVPPEGGGGPNYPNM